MTYQQLFYLKFKKGISTYELIRLYPNSARQVSEVALLDVPEDTLRDILKEERDFLYLMSLKRKFSEFLTGSN